MSGYDDVLEAVRTHSDGTTETWDGRVQARCPAHDDNRASLSLKEADDGKALLFCHAGCETRDVVAALNLEMSDLFPRSHGAQVVDTYDYRDESGKMLYRVVRLDPKGFYQQRYDDGGWVSGLADVRRVLYQLPELVATDRDTPVYVCEGEKDVDALRRMGCVATTLLGGANKWRDEYASFFEGRSVILVGDNDDPGRAHVDMLRDRLSGVAADITTVFPAVGKDVSDHLNARLGLGDLVMENDGLDEFGPLDWTTWEDEPIDWLLEPYIPRQGRVLAFGSNGSLKSLWSMWVAAKLAMEGKKVAYFALEMLPGDIARRMRQLSPPRENMLVFTRDLRLGSPSHTEKIMAGLVGFDLIVIDSWSSARAHDGRESNEAVASLDNEVLLPIMRQTGASILMLDNTGHDMMTENGVIRNEHARGASAKQDKMEVALWFHRPDSQNNYRTAIAVKKMRLNYPAPSQVIVETPQERIEFYYVTSGIRTETSMWPEQDAQSQDVEETTPVVSSDDMTPAERRALARMMDKFKIVEPDVGGKDTEATSQ